MSFQSIKGHEKEIGILRRAALNGRLAHALLLAGPEGVGKRTVALELAKALNCSVGEMDACGRCVDCAAIEAGAHQNLKLVYPVDKDNDRSATGLIKIAQVREAQASVRYRAEGGQKVVVVDGAERFMPQAANAFLKTLEEPPHGTVIILITPCPSALLPTILSRCQRISFKPLDQGQITALLMDKKGLGRDEALAAARISGGSAAKALLYAEGGALQRRQEVLTRLSSIARGEVEEALRFAEELSKSDSLDEDLESMKVWYRDQAAAREAGRAGAAAKDPVECFSMVEEARVRIMPPRNANRQLTLEALMLGIVM